MVKCDIIIKKGENMNKNQLLELYREIYGEKNVELNYEMDWELCPDVLYSLSYDDDDFRNAVVIDCNEDETQFFLSDAGQTILAFDDRAIFETMPSIKNLMEKYDVEFDGIKFFLKLQQYDVDYLKQRTSDFMCFVYSVWYFALDLSMYAFPILERGHFFDEEIEKQLIHKGLSLPDVVEKLKTQFDSFAFDEVERMYYIIKNDVKHYLAKSYDGYLFCDWKEKKEEFWDFQPQADMLDYDLLLKTLKNVFPDEFSEEEKSFSTFIFQDNQPIKFWLVQENGFCYFTDNGRARKNFKQQVSDEKFSKLANFGVHNNELRLYLNSKFLAKPEYESRELRRNLVAMALNTKDLNEFDFSNIKKMETKLNSFENIKHFLTKYAKFECEDNQQECFFERKIDLLDDIKIKFTLQKSREFCYLAIKNTFEGEKLEKVKNLLSKTQFEFDCKENCFKVKIFENGPDALKEKIYYAVNFVVCFDCLVKILNGQKLGIEQQSQNACDFEVLLPKLHQWLDGNDFFGFFCSTYSKTPETRYVNFYAFNRGVYGDAIICLSLKNVDDKIVVFSDLLEQELRKGNEKLQELVDCFQCENNIVDLQNYKEKISSMFKLVIVAKMLGFVG